MTAKARFLSAERVGVRVTCAVCGNTKQPIGRSAPPEMFYCDVDRCRGYRERPYPGSLWPGESERDFGYPVGPEGTTDIER